MDTSLGRDMKVRWVAWRNGVIGSAAFQRWATRFPLTRGVARKRARETFSLVAGFVYSQVLSASVASGLLELLSQGPVSETQVADACALSEASARRLLKAAASLGIAEAVGQGRYMLGQAGAAIHADPGIIAMVRHHALLYADLADPLALLRKDGGGGRLSEFWPYAETPGKDDTAASAYSALMAASQPMVARQVIDAYDFSRHRRMLDVGGGQGAFALAVGESAPHLERAVFDLAHVVARIPDPAISRFPGSFFDQPLPKGFDLITLIRILHDHDDAAMLRLLCAAREALDPGATLLVAEPMAGLKRDGAMADAYFGFYLLAMGSGRARQPKELREALKTAGFRSSQLIETALPLVARVIVATA